MVPVPGMMKGIGFSRQDTVETGEGTLRRTTSKYAGGNTFRSPVAVAQGGLHGERLHKMVVFVLREDGSTEYSTMTLRALYNYVVLTITEACRKANEERQKSKRQRCSHLKLFTADDNASDAEDTEIDAIAEEEGDNDNGSSNPSMTPSSGSSLPEYHPPTTPHANSNTIPPHLPSLNSSNATPPSDSTNSLPTPIVSNPTTSNQSIDRSPHKRNQNRVVNVKPKQRSQNYQHHEQQRAAQTAFTLLPNNGGIHRERLGGYLHPRDMRRLVTPFSSSNEPQLMVRRHVMLLNFDPLRAVVLRDRLLVLVPDGADSMLIELERRVRGGIAEMENQVFGKISGEAALTFSRSTSGNTTEQATEDDCDDDTDEWENMQKMNWGHMPYELQSVDAVLQTVISMLMDDARRVHQKAVSAMSELRGDSPQKSAGGLGERAQERLRLHKDEVNIMEGRVQGFVRAMNEVLDDDEDMALMNLSRLITRPERFLHPLSQAILHEESDEPELILEAYLQQALSIVNELDLLKGQIITTEEQINMTLDTIRNRLLYINTLLSVASLCVALGSFIGSIFGMNLTNHIEYNETAFSRVTVGVLVGMLLLWAILSWIFVRAANIQSGWRKKTM